jgi:hypothetical protein
MTLATAIADLETARAERQDEMNAIDAALRELRMIRSGREGQLEQPGPMPSFQAITPEGDITPQLKLKILDYALTHTVQETANQFAVAQQHIFDWRASRAQIEKEAGVSA